MDKAKERSMFELALPLVFIILPLPLLIWFLVPEAPNFMPAALKVPFFNALVGAIDKKKSEAAFGGKIILLFIIWFLLLLALSGPRFVGKPQPLAREGYNIMLALDLSGSMELTDMTMHGRKASRLAVVKHAAKEFVKERTGDKIGLILFGSNAYLQTPLTYDHNNVLQRIDDATVGLAGKTTSIGDAIGLSVKRLQSVPKSGRIIILLTDGVNNSGVLAPLKAALLAHGENIKVYTIGLGSEASTGTLDGLFFNMNATADLDEDTLKEVAKITGGRYFRATDSKSLQNIYKIINQIVAVSQDQATIRPQHDYYPWPLALGMLLFLYWLVDWGALKQYFKLNLRREVVE